jgi:hypothetical protein
VPPAHLNRGETRARAGMAVGETTSGKTFCAPCDVLGNQRPFELGDGARHLQREHALWRGGVDRVVRLPEPHHTGMRQNRPVGAGRPLGFPIKTPPRPE